MKARIVAVALCLAALFALPGCSSILDDSVTEVTAHEKPTAASPEKVIEAGSYEELKARARDFIKARAETGVVHVSLSKYGGDISQDISRACTEIMTDDPYGAYAVLNMTGTSQKIVSYYEVVFTIDYNSEVTKKQLESIIQVPTLRYLKSVLQDKLTSYALSLTILTTNLPLTEEDKDAMVQEIYYENPMEIVMMPIPTVKFYPQDGTDRIADFKFGYSRYEPGTLIAMSEDLRDMTRRFAGSVTGKDDGAILLSLCQKLMGSVEYDDALAESGDYSTQNIVATAYGALINGSAIGEGYAMAYKALCDELGYDCDVVIGTLDGKPHAWNIIEFGSDYYHVDTSMCDVEGLDAAFMKNDTEMQERYSWDRAKYTACSGPSYEIPAENDTETSAAIEEAKTSPSPTT